MRTRTDNLVRRALAAVDSASTPVSDKVEMLMEVAIDLQRKPKSPDELKQAVFLYEKALEICPPEQYLLRARAHARLGTAFQAMPDGGCEALTRALENYEVARDILKSSGEPEELAELRMNMGLVIQSLATAGRARMKDAISAYQESLRTFTAEEFPKEYAILHNNLATAFLSMPFTDERGRMREALAVQSFEEGLKVASLVDHPSEYAMLQNNLGNALQYVSSSHAVENNLRALDAYEEALKVRKRENMPVEYANTICNKANCLRNLPDDVEHPERGNSERLRAACSFYMEARVIFVEHGEEEKVEVVDAVVAELLRDGAVAAPGNGAGGGDVVTVR